MITALQARTLCDILAAYRQSHVAGELTHLGAFAPHLSARYCVLALEIEALERIAAEREAMRAFTPYAALHLHAFIEQLRVHTLGAAPWSAEQAEALDAVDAITRPASS